MNIVQFRKYCNENFGMDQWGEEIQDTRKRPVITTFQVFESVCEMPVFGQKSLLEFDEFSRTSEARKWHSSHRAQVASDTSVERITEGIKRESVQAIGYEVVEGGDEGALWDLKLPSAKKIRLGIVDGHHAGGIWTSVLAVSGKTDGVVDLERYPGRGHELVASREVLKRAFGKLGDGYFQIIDGDGLYSNREDFQLCLDHGSHLLVKTDEKNLVVIQDAMYLFACQEASPLEGVHSQKGLDRRRLIEYRILWTEGLDWQGLKMTVAWVRGHYLKPSADQPEDVEFWVLTTATGFTGEDLRELAHRRWEIENNIFKRLNQLVRSKRQWSHKPRVMEMLLRIWMIGLTLFGAYLLERGWNTFEKTWESMRKTWRAVTRLMRQSLLESDP